MLDEALTARIAAAKRRLLDGGLLQEVEWGCRGPNGPTGPTWEKNLRVFTA